MSNAEQATPKIDASNPGVEYSIDGTKVIRTHQGDAQHVANFRDGTLELIKPQYRNWITRWLAEAAGLKVVRVVAEGEAEDKPKAPIEAAPKFHPLLGDKTPAYVEWLEKNDFAQFKTRYGILGPKDRNGLYPALRKTHITKKVESGVVSDDTTSWDAPTGLEPEENEGGES